MSGNHLIFDAVNASEIAPEGYDSSIYSYRYRNGIRAESIGGFTDAKRRLEQLLRIQPYTTEQLARELTFDRQLLQKILDYLFTHTGEVAALDIPQQSTLYIWADIEVAENIRSRFALNSVDITTDDYNADDVTAIASYLTNLLVLKPSVGILDDAIDKCRLLLDAARLAQAFQPSPELVDRISLLRKKYEQLVARREQEYDRWSRDEEDEEDAGQTTEPEIDILPETSSAIRIYPFSVLYLLGSSYSYTGPEIRKHMCIDDPELAVTQFDNLKTVVIEMDTFIADLESGCSILGVVETFTGSIFNGKELSLQFRRLSGAKYKRNIERLMHEEVLRIRERGYRITTL